MHEVTFESIETVSQDDFAEWVARRLAGDIARYELLNGRIVMNPPAVWPHGRSENRVARVIDRHVVAKDLGEVFGSSQGFALPSGDTIAADATFVSKERWAAAPPPEPGKFLRVVPDLVVEVLSPSTASRDRGEKKGIYERNSVREYWLLDPRARNLVRFTNEGGHFDAGKTFVELDSVSSKVLPDLVTTVGDLLGNP